MQSFPTQMSALLPVALVSLLAAACSQQQPDAVEPAPQAAMPIPEDALPTAPKLAAGTPVVGRYVDPQSQVTGLDSKFAITDRVFASLPLTGTTAGTVVSGRLLDAQGTELADREIQLLGGESSVNFDFAVGTSIQLRPGQHKIEFMLMGQPAGSVEFAVE